jgi:DNA-directed RNA polymerase subunit F
MARPEVLNEKPIPLFEIKSELESIKKRDKTLNFRSEKTDEYLNQFLDIPEKTYEEVKAKIEALKITRLKPEMLIKILDIMPKTADDLKNVLQGYVVSLSNEDIKKIIGIIEETAPAKK